MAELKGDLFEAVEVDSLDWKQLGKGLGLSTAQIGGLLTEGDGNMEDMLRSVHQVFSQHQHFCAYAMQEPYVLYCSLAVLLLTRAW